MSAPWRATAEGIVVACRLTPKGGRDAIEGVRVLSDGTAVLACRVREPPEDGRANAGLCRLIAEAAGARHRRGEVAAQAGGGGGRGGGARGGAGEPAAVTEPPPSRPLQPTRRLTEPAEFVVRYRRFRGNDTHCEISAANTHRSATNAHAKSRNSCPRISVTPFTRKNSNLASAATRKEGLLCLACRSSVRLVKSFDLSIYNFGGLLQAFAVRPIVGAFLRPRRSFQIGGVPISLLRLPFKLHQSVIQQLARQVQIERSLQV